MESDRFRLNGKGRLHDVVIAKDKIRRWPGEWTEQTTEIEEGLNIVYYYHLK